MIDDGRCGSWKWALAAVATRATDPHWQDRRRAVAAPRPGPNLLVMARGAEHRGDHSEPRVPPGWHGWEGPGDDDLWRNSTACKHWILARTHALDPRTHACTRSIRRIRVKARGDSCSGDLVLLRRPCILNLLPAKIHRGQAGYQRWWEGAKMMASRGMLASYGRNGRWGSPAGCRGEGRRW